LTCPVCGWRPGEWVEPDWGQTLLAAHVLGQHLNAYQGEGSRWKVCFCGQLYDKHYQENFRRHMEQMGGVVAHYWACKLGVD